MESPTQTPIRPTDLAALLEVSVPYASQLLTGARVPSIPLALRIFDKAAIKLGPIANATDEEIETVRRMTPAETPRDEAAAA